MRHFANYAALIKSPCIINFGAADSLRFQKPTNVKPETVIAHFKKTATFNS
jgi:hypothetical protein